MTYSSALFPFKTKRAVSILPSLAICSLVPSSTLVDHMPPVLSILKVIEKWWKSFALALRDQYSVSPECVEDAVFFGVHGFWLHFFYFVKASTTIL